jgi:peptidoglycan/xylan/chitin deacetylase (PgdA/CDA1 family)
MRIPITMCHGVHDPSRQPEARFTREHFDGLISIAADMGFSSVNYNDLAAWRAGAGEMPARPIMIDFDHPERSIRYECFEVLERYGFKGNLFINTGRMAERYAGTLPPEEEAKTTTWGELGELLDAGWHIGAHTVTHPNLSDLSRDDPTGDKIRAELEQCDEAISHNLGFTPRDFAFTGTSWSSAAEREVKRRYRFGRLWIVGAEYQADGETIRYAELVGVPGHDEVDGGPPYAARYITEESAPYRLPSMELERLVFEPDAFRRYLEMALA